MPFFHDFQLNLIIFAIVKQKKKRNKVNLIRKGFQSIWNSVNKYNDDRVKWKANPILHALYKWDAHFLLEEKEEIRTMWENRRLNDIHTHTQTWKKIWRERARVWGRRKNFYRSHGALLIIHSCHMLWICDIAMWLFVFFSC